LSEGKSMSTQHENRISYPYMAGAVICWVIDAIYQTRETVFHPKTEKRVENTTHRGIGTRAGGGVVNHFPPQLISQVAKTVTKQLGTNNF